MLEEGNLQKILEEWPICIYDWKTMGMEMIAKSNKTVDDFHPPQIPDKQWYQIIKIKGATTQKIAHPGKDRTSSRYSPMEHV